MTLICAVADEKTGKVWMGADGASAVMDADSIFRVKTPKMSRKVIPPPTGNLPGIPLLIGNTGLHVLGAHIEHFWDPPYYNNPIDPFFYTWELADHLREYLKRKDLWPVICQEPPNESLWDARLLVGFSGRLFHIGTDGSVDEFQRDYHAIGSGEAVAWGALAATPNDPPEYRVRIALEAATYHLAPIQEPYTIMEA